MKEFEECHKSYKCSSKEEFLLNILKFWKEKKSTETAECKSSYKELENTGTNVQRPLDCEEEVERWDSLKFDLENTFYTVC